VTTEQRNDLVRYGASRTGMYDPVDYTLYYSRNTPQTAEAVDGGSDDVSIEPGVSSSTPQESPTPQDHA
jgi:hypothetical protein